MNTRTASSCTTPSSESTCTAFLGLERISWGSFREVGAALDAMNKCQGDGLLVFDDATGALVDYPWPAGFAPEPSSAPQAPEPEEKPVGAPSVGRPKLGVVAREVTLLPRHWEWLATQSGGASAALRRLVEQARKTHAEQDAQRQAKERAYRFMSAIGSGLPGFEEASRALFAHDSSAFAERIRDWPADVQAHLGWLARSAFATA